MRNFIIGLALGILLMLIPYTFKSTIPKPILKTDTIHTTSIDTIFIDKIKYVKTSKLDTIFIYDTILIKEQKIYEDTISTIWISGINPEIDSIKYRLPRDTFFITNEIEQKRINKGIILGIGLGGCVIYNPITGRIEPGIGINASIGFGFCIGKRRKIR